jgi:hypothetical protein
MRRAFWLAALIATPAPGASQADVDQLVAYAAILGRAKACGEEIREPLGRVGTWIEDRFPNGSRDQAKYVPTFLSMMEFHAQRQEAGAGPTDCNAVRRAFAGVRWP